MAFYGQEFLKGVYNTNPKDFKEVYRANAKQVGLALLYGGSWKVVQRGLGVSEAEARKLHTAFFTALSGFKKHIQHEEQVARKHLKVKNLFGSVIHLDDINSKDFRVAGAVMNKLYNYPIQSIAADLIKLILVRISEFVESNQLSQLEGNLINEPLYNRVVTIRESELTLDLELALESLPQGSVLVCLTNDNDEIVSSWDTPLQISTDFIRDNGLTIFW